MIVHGILNVSGFLLLLWALNLVQRNRLYVGYGVIFLFFYLGLLMTEVCFPDKIIFSLALGFVFFLLAYILMQVTLISNRLVAVVQGLAINHAKHTVDRDISLKL